jgi:hypothetical protein
MAATGTRWVAAAPARGRATGERPDPRQGRGDVRLPLGEPARHLQGGRLCARKPLFRPGGPQPDKLCYT